MRIKKTPSGILELDMTPMIDMTFQLIAFFMFALNFSQSEQNEAIELPSSELAKPADAPFEHAITLQLTKEANVIIGGQEIPLAALRPFLIKERQLLESEKRPLTEATVIVRGDKNAEAGKVQELIKRCQDVGFESFSLRAREEVGT